MNESGEYLLSFCAMNEFCTMNKMFAKNEDPSVYLATSRK